MIFPPSPQNNARYFPSVLKKIWKMWIFSWTTHPDNTTWQSVNKDLQKIRRSTNSIISFDHYLNQQILTDSILIIDMFYAYIHIYVYIYNNFFAGNSWKNQNKAEKYTCRFFKLTKLRQLLCVYLGQSMPTWCSVLGTQKWIRSDFCSGEVEKVWRWGDRCMNN